MLFYERRLARRFPLGFRGYAVINGCAVGMQTYDVSQGGGLVKFDTHIPLRKGEKLLFRFDMGLVGRAVICRAGSSGNCPLYGIRFDRFDSRSDLILLAYLIKYERHIPIGASIQ